MTEELTGATGAKYQHVDTNPKKPSIAFQDLMLIDAVINTTRDTLDDLMELRRRIVEKNSTT